MTNVLLIYGENLSISSYIRKPFLIYDLASDPICISLYMRKILFSFLSVQGNLVKIWQYYRLCIYSRMLKPVFLMLISTEVSFKNEVFFSATPHSPLFPLLYKIGRTSIPQSSTPFLLKFFLPFSSCLFSSYYRTLFLLL